MTSEKFRRQLRQEAERWWQDGTIDATLYSRLAERYRFNQLETEARNRFTTILVSLGGILLGLGAITFVAANWLVWSRAEKLALLLSVFLSVSMTGFWLWRSSSRGGCHKLGAALLLFGSLLLGANIGLVSQMFHQSGPLYQLLFVWSGGVWLMAASLQMPALAILATVLAGSAYAPAMVDAAYTSQLDAWQTVALYTPLIALVLFMPLAWMSRSRVTFAFTSILLSGSLTVSALLPQTWANESALVLPPALLWAYGTQPPQRFALPAFQAIARVLALVFAAGLFYVLSFNFWAEFQLDYWHNLGWSAPLTVNLLAIAALTLWLWLRPPARPLLRFWRQPLALNNGSLAAMFLAASATIYLHLQGVALDLFAPILFNLLFFGLAIALLRDGLALGSRSSFWASIALLVLGIATRMLEYNTGLLLKAFVFAACGLGIIFAGLWFERRVQVAGAPALPNPLPPTEENPHD